MYSLLPFLGKNAFISIVFNQKLLFLVSIQDNIIIRNTLSSKHHCLHYLLHENMVLPGNI